MTGMHVVVMGVAGCGKSAVGERIAQSLGLPLIVNDNLAELAPEEAATFQNIGATDHEGIETAADYTFGDDSALAGLNVYANYTYTKAIQESGVTSGMDVPFYSRNTDTVGARYRIGAFTANLSSTHQGKQYSDAANTVAESANGGVGQIPGFRLWNAQLGWKLPGKPGYEVMAGINNLSYTPKDAFTSWTSYTLPFGLTVGGGANWESRTWTNDPTAPANTGGQIVQGSFALVNLMARYDFNKRMSATLNVNNLFDKKYYSQIGFYNQGWYGAPQNVMLSLRAQY